MPAGEEREGSSALTKYVNDFEGDIACRLVTIAHEDVKEMNKLDTQMTNGEAPAAEANDSPVSEAEKNWD